MKLKVIRLAVLGLLLMAGEAGFAQRIVSVDGTISEILVALGLESKIVGVDITSTYPKSLGKLPKVGHNRTIGAEGVLSLKPDLVLLSNKGMVKPQVIEQLKSSGKKVQIFDQSYSPEGTKKLIRDVAAAFNVSAKGEMLVKKLEADLKRLTKKQGPPQKILFVYARGTGTMMVAGQGTPADEMIRLSGNINAAQGFKDYKPLTPESLVAANPDAYLLFDSGLESLGGADGLFKVPGVNLTNGGKARRFVTMDGLLLMGFGPRLGQALLQLSQKVK